MTAGRFTAVDEVDLGAPYSGPESGPPFPGEDFLAVAPAGVSFPADLAGQVAVISLEPSPDDGSSPFTLKPLAGNIPEDAGDHVTYSLDNNSTGFPVGTATIS